MFAELLAERLRGAVVLSASQVRALERHYELLVRWNKVLNLTSVRTLEEAIERHYCESLFLAGHLPAGPLSIADLGSGAGFPGIPVAVARPDCNLTLIESHQRKAVFLREAARELTNVRVLAQRAENIPETFDWAISRAVNIASVASTLSRMANSVALLSNEDQPDLPHFTWAHSLRLPWGDRHFLWSGHRSSAI